MFYVSTLARLRRTTICVLGIAFWGCGAAFAADNGSQEMAGQTAQKATQKVTHNPAPSKPVPKAKPVQARPKATPKASAKASDKKPQPIKPTTAATAVKAVPKPVVAIASPQEPVETTPVFKACTEFVKYLPSVSMGLCQAAVLRDSGARSVQGRSLWMTDVLAKDAKLRVLIIGAIHGDEPTAASVVMHWISMAQVAPANTPQPVTWRFIPVLNPDGLMDHPSHRTNAHGVDLNRNFPTPNWERDADNYWTKRTKKDPRRWPGPKPLSEPESRFLYDEMLSFKPDLIVSIHAPYGLLDFDGPTVPPSRLGRLYLDQVGVYPGSLGNFAGVNRGVPVVTIELPNASKAPLDAEIRQMWLDLLRWMNVHLPTNKALLPVPSVSSSSPVPKP